MYHTLLRMRLADGWANPFVPASVFRQQVTLVEQWLFKPAGSTLLRRPSPPHPPSLLPPVPAPPLPVPPPPSPPSSPLPLSPPPPPYSSMLPSSPTQRPPTSDEVQSDDDDDEVQITGERLVSDDVMGDCELDDGEEPIFLRWEAPASISVDATLLSGIKNHPFSCNSIRSSPVREARLCNTAMARRSTHQWMRCAASEDLASTRLRLRSPLELRRARVIGAWIANRDRLATSL
ncbi:hypothetical protein PQX77_020863 [Marasmius sp. AFHP31]|nr:hypothetical protein PQX77_020863 [Marasmius sp. AFHP31]